MHRRGLEMADRVLSVANDDDDNLVKVSVGGSRISEPMVEAFDPFAVAGEDILKMEGISTNLRRKISREINKAEASRYTTQGGAFSGMTGATPIIATQPAGREGTGSKRLEPVEVTAYAMFSVVTPTYNHDYLAKIYELNAAHYAAVNAKVSNVIGLGFDLVDTFATRAKIDEIPDNDVDRLNKMRRKIEKNRNDLNEYLDTLNNADSFLETLKKVYKDYEITGNGYLEIGRTATGKIGYVGHIPATTVRVRRKRDGFVQIVNYRAMFFRNYGDTETPDQVGMDPQPNEIIHIKNYTPTNVYYGVPDVISATTAIAGDQFAAKFNLDYFENKAVPRYIITVKGAKLSAESERKLLEFFQTGLKGSNHRTLYIPLPADEGNSKVEFKMDPVEAGVQDSSFHQYRQDNRLEILMAHRVPLTKVSIIPGVSLANARDADKTFREQVTRPIQEDLEWRINKIIGEFTDMFKLKFKELTLTDEDTQSKIDERYLRMQVITPNDVRLRNGWIPLDGGDKVVELKPQQAAEQRTAANGNRLRDQNRSANSPDNSGEGRNAQGEGRQQS